MIKRILKDSILYTLANLFTKGIGFLMLPIYLSFLTKKEYGIFDYISTVSRLMLVLITLEIAQAVLRFSAEGTISNEIRKNYISNGVLFTFLVYSLLIIIVHFNLEFFSYLLTESTHYTSVASQASLLFFVSAMLYLSIVIYRANLKAKAAVLSSASSALLSAILSFVMLYYMKLGLEGLILGLIVGQALTAVFNYYKLRDLWFCIPDITKLFTMLKFSSPLVFSSVGVVLITLTDRVMVKELMGLEELAVYAVAAKVSLALALLSVGFQSAIAPIIYKSYRDVKASKALRKLFLYYSVVSFFAILFFFILSDVIVQIIAGEDYSEASSILPVLCASVLIFNSYVFFPGLSISKKTYVLAIINLIVGGANLVLNYLFIPAFGVFGAAVSSLISAIFFMVFNVLLSEKYYPVLFPKIKTPNKIES